MLDIIAKAELCYDDYGATNMMRLRSIVFL
jgi:hypothetical protein